MPSSFYRVRSLRYAQAGFLIHLVRQLIDDDGDTAFFTKFFKVRLGAHDDATTTSAITITHTRDTIDQSPPLGNQVQE